MKKKIVPLIVVAAAVAAAIWYMQQKRRPRDLVLAGTLEARTVNVGSLVGGRVVRVHVDEGHRVGSDQVLVTLETETIDRQLAEQRAAIDTAKANLAKVLAGPREEEISKAAAIASNDARERQRMSALYREGIIARELFEDADTRAKTSAKDLELLRRGTRAEDIAAARAQVEQQQRRHDSLLKLRAETEVRSPIGGLVQSFGLRPGDIVGPNQTVAELLEPDQLWVRIYVPETLLGLVEVNHPVKVRVDTFPDRWFPGRVSTISSRAEYTPRNVQTRAQRADQMFAVKVLVDPSPELKAGMAAEVDLGVKGRFE